ncbi:hypothetical protein OZ379_003134 [Salmonella enterica]|uniref:Uncharacterized protein n=2 Tax=Salmonella enterica TaxID=28901 RepID=A0A7Z1Q804_SALET|nr:hypothetical protein [Salmonella enterica]ECC3881774.1 hypothetical protein [Salmonella enterica subsp. diarizonae]ECT9718181.1 hypothetical protein [Salmonella enterica subsp. diarizonae str. CFSAN000553]EGE4751303.1 hypothetical protein [Salmonella enterica subsp. diarizonae serovar 38:[k]:z35]SUG59558.1 Uncharacterised protein [Salmonella enterica subsp. arizonae]HAE8612641.1 hypothetical protein [Salmonella enterica subsp. salamae serovar 30:1,z28:z6]HAF0277293.1 hypothetical protein [
MSKENISSNKSTELFYDLACRSFTASWEMFMEVNGDGDANDYLDDPGFVNLFNIYVIDHIQNNFERFTVQEGNSGDINQVDFELVAAMLVEYSEGFIK